MGFGDPETGFKARWPGGWSWINHSRLLGPHFFARKCRVQCGLTHAHSQLTSFCPGATSAGGPSTQRVTALVPTSLHKCSGWRWPPHPGSPSYLWSVGFSFCCQVSCFLFYFLCRYEMPWWQELYFKYLCHTPQYFCIISSLSPFHFLYISCFWGYFL